MVDKNLLLVEDDSATREVMSLLLEGDGWTVHSVPTGEAALLWLGQQDRSPAVVLCDVRLPGIQGDALGAAVHRAAKSSKPCLISMSASAHRQVPGFAAGLLKPFPPSAVQDVWERYSAGSLTGCRADARDTGSASSIDVRVPPPKLEGLPVIEEATVRLLQDSMGLHGVQGLYAFALGDAGDRLDRMTSAITAADADLYAREAHALKGTGGMIGARQLWQLAGDAEMEGLNSVSDEKVSRMRVAIQAARLMLGTLFPV